MKPKIYYLVSCLTSFQAYQIKKWDKENRKDIGFEENSVTFDDVYKNISRECFLPYPKWVPPTKDEVAYILKKTGMTQKQAAEYIGLSNNNGRTFRRFTMGESTISYAYWVLLCQYIGMPKFW